MSVEENMEERKPSYTVGWLERKMGAATVKNSVAFPYKTKTRITM